MTANREEIGLYLAEAHQMLQAAADTLALGHLSTSVNRSYYAVFYAASALLQSVDQTRAKHYGVFSASANTSLRVVCGRMNSAISTSN